MTASWLNYGATLMDWRAPDGTPLVLGLGEPSRYLDNPAFVGVSVGRVANRIAHGRFTVDGTSYRVATSETGHALHSGPDGFDRQVWEMAADGDALVLRHTSPDGHQGYPGRIEVKLLVRLNGSHMAMEYNAVTDAETPLSLTLHSYFTLGTDSVDALSLRVPADRYAAVDEEQIATGGLREVTGRLDLRDGNAIGDRSLDHSYEVDGTGERDMAVLSQGAHTVRVRSTLPSLQVFTGETLSGVNGLEGRSGLALEPQYPPGAVNHPGLVRGGFASVMLSPGEDYRHRIIYAYESRSA